MMRKLLPKDIHLDYLYPNAIEGCAHVYGYLFGPKLLAVTDSIDEVIDEADERFGRRVDLVADARDLADFDGDSIEEQIESAIMHGEIRVNGGGTMVWVDPHEWLRSFHTVREAADFFRGLDR